MTAHRILMLCSRLRPRCIGGRRGRLVHRTPQPHVSTGASMHPAPCAQPEALAGDLLCAGFRSHCGDARKSAGISWELARCRPELVGVAGGWPASQYSWS